MPFNKIQPEQLQMPTFFSDLGDIALNVTETGVGLNLSRGLTGNFNFTGQLLVDGRHTVRSADTGLNAFDPASGSLVINGTDNTLGDFDGVCINGLSNDISGTMNISLNGNQQQFGSGTQGNFGVGAMAYFLDETTGSVVLTDGLSNSVTSIGNHCMNVDFDGGIYLNGGQIVAQTPLRATTAASGLFSGDFSVLGDSYLTGYNVSTIHDLTGILTGENFVNVGEAGSIQNVVGQKRFETGILHTMPYYREIYNDVTIMSGQLAMSGEHLMFKREDGHWTGIAMQVIP